MDGDIVLDMVNHLNHHSISFPSNDVRSWKLPIHTHNALRVAQSCHILQLDLERFQQKVKQNFKQYESIYSIIYR